MTVKDIMTLLESPDRVRVIKDGEEIYWEHEGMMDKQEYARNAVRKIELYQKNGIYPGERLILTFETEQSMLNQNILEKLVEKYL